MLNETLFFSLDQARQMVAAWIEDYNTARPHSSLAYETPATFAAKLAATGPTGHTTGQVSKETG